MQDVLCIGSAAALYRIGTAAKKGQPRDLPALASALSALDHCYSDESLTSVPISVTYTSESRPSRTQPGRHSQAARASAVPARGLATRDEPLFLLRFLSRC